MDHHTLNVLLHAAVQVRFVQPLPLVMELIDNAITYSENSAQQDVRVQYRHTGFEHGSGLPEIRVTDQGMGMSKEGAQKYFVEGFTTAGEGPTITRGETCDCCQVYRVPSQDNTIVITSMMCLNV